MKRIIAHTFGDRSINTLIDLMNKLKGFNVKLWCTDNFVAYKKIPSNKHLVGKLYTQAIERMNLNLRTRIKRLNRKTISYSKSIDLHDKIISTFIEREHYY